MSAALFFTCGWYVVGVGAGVGVGVGGVGVGVVVSSGSSGSSRSHDEFLSWEKELSHETPK